MSDAWITRETASPPAATDPTRVLILSPYPQGRVPGQRFRYEQYLDRLRCHGIEFDTQSFLDEPTMAVLYTSGNLARKLLGVLRGFGRRLGMLRRVRQYDFVFVYREASPVGPPLIEWALFMMGCRVIYDFDDAIFIAQRSRANPFMPYIRCAWKVDYITRRAHMVTVCNPYLVEWAGARTSHVSLIPTTIDEDYHRPPAAAPGPRPAMPIIGWTGTHSTARYLDLVRPALVELQKRHEFEFRVICDTDPGFPELWHYRFVKWQMHSEIEDLSQFQIGLMPVPEEAWAHGKVGFKAIQYGALGIVQVVSAVGSGHEVVENGESGFVVQNDTASWVSALDRLLSDPARAAEMGEHARQFILSRYSVRANLGAYLQLFDRS